MLRHGNAEDAFGYLGFLIGYLIDATSGMTATMNSNDDGYTDAIDIGFSSFTRMYTKVL
jgi:hypothetical protein